jgi:hypothetical protein
MQEEPRHPLGDLNSAQPDGGTVNAYEEERLKRIQRNQTVLQQMGLREMATEVVTSAIDPDVEPAEGRTRKQQRRCNPSAKTSQGPLRTSSRRRGTRITDAIHSSSPYVPGSTELKTEPKPNGLLSDPPNAEKSTQHLLPAEDYFKSIGKDVSDALRIDGQFKGWVPSVVAERHGVLAEGATTDASRKASASQHIKAKGWSGARAKSAMMLQTNPNAFFYRHVAPDKQQAQGEWTPIEHQAFMDTARKFGVGDRWGLFASHVGTRVGYQCSAYYTQVIIPSGEVIDPRFMLTRSGKAVFVG